MLGREGEAGPIGELVEGESPKARVVAQDSDRLSRSCSLTGSGSLGTTLFCSPTTPQPVTVLVFMPQSSQASAVHDGLVTDVSCALPRA